jgi:hypothetical protein
VGPRAQRLIEASGRAPIFEEGPASSDHIHCNCGRALLSMSPTLSRRACTRRSLQYCTIERAPHFHNFSGDDQSGRRLELEAVTAVTDAGAFEVAPISVRQRLRDQFTIDINIKADGRSGMIRALCPAGDATRTDEVDKTAQRANSRLLIRCLQTSAQRNASARGFKFVAVPQAGGAIL